MKNLLKYLLPFVLVLCPFSAKAQTTWDFTNVNILTGGTETVQSGGNLTLAAGSSMTVNLTGYGNNKLLGLTSSGGAVGVIGLGAGMSISGGNLVAASSTSANPSATVGTSAVNGVATTFMTSDSAPAINLAMVPTWTGQHTFSPTAAKTSGTGYDAGIDVTPTLNQRNAANFYGIHMNETVTQAGTGTQDLEWLGIGGSVLWEVNKLGNVVTGGWAASPIGSSYGGAGTVSGVLSANGSGVVSAAISGTGITIASQTISLASITSGYVVGNNTGSGATPQGVSLSSMIDTIGLTQGDILYRNGSSWTVLAPATVHNVLESGGASANVDWTGTPTFSQLTLSGASLPILSAASTVANNNELVDLLSTNGPDSDQSYIYLGQSKATQKSAIIDFYLGTSGNSYNDSQLAIGFYGETPTSDFDLKKGGVLSLGGTSSTFTENGTTASTSITTGAIVDAGGLGVSLGAYIGNALNVAGTAYTYGALPSGATTAGTAITVPATTYTVTGTNTATNFQATYLGIPTFTNASAGTITNAATLTIAGAPVAAGSQIITNAYAINVLAGAVNLGSGAITSTGSIVLNSATGGSQGAGTINATGIYVNGVSIGTSVLSSNNTWTGTNAFNNTVSGTGITALFASPPAIGGTTAAAGSFTTLSASGTSTLTGNVSANAITLGTASGGQIFNTVNAGANDVGFGLINTGGSSFLGIEGSAGGYWITGTAAYGLSLVSGAGRNLYLGTNGNYLALTLDTSQNATFAGEIVGYKGITTAGLGVPVVVASANISAQSSNATITSYSNPATDADFDVRAQMSVTASTTLITTITCTYTDVANVSRTMVMPIQSLAGTFVAAGAISGAGASIWETPTMHIRAKASTTITLLTSSGTFTAVTYSASGVITKLN